MIPYNASKFITRHCKDLQPCFSSGRNNKWDFEGEFDNITLSYQFSTFISNAFNCCGILENTKINDVISTKKLTSLIWT